MRNKSSFYGLGQGLEYGNVYYKSLLHPNNPVDKTSFDPRQLINQNLAAYQNTNSKQLFKSIGSTLIQQSKNEFEKELSFLRNIFGTKISINFDSDIDWDAELTTTFNKCLQLEEVLARIISHYEHGNVKATDYFIFGDCLKKAWEENASWISAIIDPNKTTKENNRILKNHILNFIIPKAVSNFSKLGISYNVDDNEYIGSLKEFGLLVNDFQSAGLDTFIHQIYNEYNLDEIVTALTNDTSKIIPVNDIKNKAEWNSVDFLRGGSIAEYFTQFVVEQFIQEITIDGTGARNKGKAFGTGNLKLKDDIMFTFGVQFKHFEKLFENNEKVSRTRNVKMMKELDNVLRNLKKGYVVHVSAKDYGKQTYRSGGFLAENNISFNTFRSINLNTSPSNQSALSLIGLLCQTLKGAILEGEQEQITQLLASQIGSFVFDDILNIGKSMTELKGVRGNEIHLFYLSGFYVPLSTLLYYLGNAFKNAEDIDKWVNVTVTMANQGKIKYGKKEEQYIKELNRNSGIKTTWTPEEWKAQRSQVLSESKIKVHFFKGLDDLLTRLSF